MLPRCLHRGSIMRSTMAPSAPVVAQDVSAVPGGAAYMTALERHLAPSCERSAPRQRALASLRGLLSPAERQTSWPLADVSGDATPYALQPDRKSTRLNSSHLGISYAVFCLKKK